MFDVSMILWNQGEFDAALNLVKQIQEGCNHKGFKNHVSEVFDRLIKISKERGGYF
jgi:hypothetical protein